MFPNKVGLLSEPHNQRGAVTHIFFSPLKLFSHLSEALKLFQTLLRKTWKALRDACCKVSLPCSDLTRQPAGPRCEVLTFG